MMYYKMGLCCHHMRLYYEPRGGCMSFINGISLKLGGLPGKFRNKRSLRRGGLNAILIRLGVNVAYGWVMASWLGVI